MKKNCTTCSMASSRPLSVITRIIASGWRLGKFRRPLIPAQVVEAATKDVIDCVIRKPRDVVLGETLKAKTVFLRSAIEEVCRGLFDQWDLFCECRAKVAGAFMSWKSASDAFQAVRSQPAIAHQEFQTDEQRIARERR